MSCYVLVWALLKGWMWGYKWQLGDLSQVLSQPHSINSGPGEQTKQFYPNHCTMSNGLVSVLVLATSCLLSVTAFTLTSWGLCFHQVPSANTWILKDLFGTHNFSVLSLSF
jgi:hypothetical protein